MCGIVGVFRLESSPLSPADAQSALSYLLRVSQSRGKDSSGVAILTAERIEVLKRGLPASTLVTLPEYRRVLARAPERFCALGHSRMETNGTFLDPSNNQPVLQNGLVLIHNGIIVNDADLWRANPDLRREFQVDTEVITALLRKELQTGQGLAKALPRTLAQLQGSYSVAAFFDDLDVVALGTNMGSLYLAKSEDGTALVFASEKRFLDEALSQSSLAKVKFTAPVQVLAGTALLIDLKDLSVKDVSETSLSPNPRPVKRVITSVDTEPARALPSINVPQYQKIEALVTRTFAENRERVRKLRRCTRCILPETMPFIRFDAQGVCTYCHRHQPRETRGLDDLAKAIEPFRKAGNAPDCVISFSGGRDSSYALHYAKKELGLRPVAFSYDWGMLTDLGRRNQARMTGGLGIEHILVAADITKKRSYIRKNVLAWLKRPRLGVVPLFMAGDKQYFYHLNKVAQSMKLDLVVYADNSLEKTDFKYGFAGVELNPEVGKAYNIGRLNSLKLLGYYGKEYLLNPGYLNDSLLDTATAYLSSYVVPKEYVYLFRYILWEEKQIEETLTGQYGWELATDTKSSWRIGDGTQAFYNYIYYFGAGLTEHDTFRSNQIREGAIGRDEALRLAEIGNEPRVDSLVWYFDTIGIDGVAALEALHARMPQRYVRTLALAETSSISAREK